MVASVTAAVLTAFIHGAIGIIVSGKIIETGDGYTKILGGNQFTNKWDAAVLMGGTAAFGFMLKYIDPYISQVVQSFSPNLRAGFLVIGSMLLLNYKVSDYNYTDWRSTVAYIIGGIFIIYPKIDLEAFVAGFL